MKSKRGVCIGVTVAIAAGIAIWLGLFPPWGGESMSDEFTIGALLPLTGSGAMYGQNAQQGIELALDKTAGFCRTRIHVVYEDTQLTPQVGLSGARKLIDVNGVSVIIGAMGSSVTQAVAPVCEDSQVVLLSPVSSAPEITNAGDYIFRVCLSDVYEGAVMASKAYEALNLRTVAILYIVNDYGVGLREVFEREFSALGGTILLAEAFDQDATDFRTQLTKIKAAAPDAVFLVGYKEMIPILIQAVELGMHTQFLSTVMFDDQEILQQAGEAAEGVIFTTWDYEPAGGYAPRDEFLDAFRERFGAEPGLFCAEAYDAMMLVGQAICDGASTADEFRDALYSVVGFEGASGVITIDENGDTVKPLMLKTVRNGRFEFLYE